MAETQFFVDAQGKYLGSFDGGEAGDYWNGSEWGAPPSGVVEVASHPAAPGQTWNGSSWIDTAASRAAGAQEAFDALIAAGLAITSTATPALSGTYACDPSAQQNISGIAAGIAARSRVPGGGATFNYGDATGNLHAFTSADFLNFADAVEDFCYAAYEALTTALGGGSWNPPAAAATIA